MKLGVITNPNSRKNRKKPDRVDALERLVGHDGLVRQTHCVEEIRPVMEEFVSEELDFWISDGGDGAFHWMLNVGNQVLEKTPAPLAKTPWMVPTNGGTVDFVARKAGLKGDADKIIRELISDLELNADHDSITIDSLELTARRPGDPVGEMPVRRLGFGIAIGGVGQRFFSNYYAQSIQGPRGIALLMAKATAGFYTSMPGLRRLPLAPGKWREAGTDILRGTRARVRVDGQDFPYEQYHALHAGSFTIDVGAIKLFPYADEPGKLHFAVGTTTPWEALPGLVDLMRGKPARGKRWHEMAGEELEVWAEGDELLTPYIDGETIEGLEYVRLRPGPAVTVPTLRTS